MNTVYLVVVLDRHTDPEIYAFSTRERAMDAAHELAADYGTGIDPDDDDCGEKEWEGTLYAYQYSSEGDTIVVVAKEVDEEVE